MADQQVVVTVDDRHLTTIEDVAAGLRAAGLRVEGVHPRTGTITGAVPADRRPDLDEVRGVAAVRSVSRFRIGPPDSDLQ